MIECRNPDREHTAIACPPFDPTRDAKYDPWRCPVCGFKHDPADFPEVRQQQPAAAAAAPDGTTINLNITLDGDGVTVE